MPDTLPKNIHAHGSQDWLKSVRGLLGIPYVYAGRNQSGFDCWGLVWYVGKTLLAMDLPNHPSHRDEADKIRRIQQQMGSGDWLEIPKPEHGAVVALGKGKRVGHVGIWVDIDGGLCLHVQRGQHVAGHTVQQLRQQGFNIVKFFRFNG